MSFKDECKSMKINTTQEQKRSAEFLERKGKKFLVDFGYGNCVGIAKREFGFRAVDPSIKTLNGMVLRLLRDHQWWTPYDLCDQILAKYAILVSDSSITARLRDLRHPEYGFHLIEKRRIVDSNAYEYRLGK